MPQSSFPWKYLQCNHPSLGENFAAVHEPNNMCGSFFLSYSFANAVAYLTYSLRCSSAEGFLMRTWVLWIFHHCPRKLDIWNTIQWSGGVLIFIVLFFWWYNFTPHSTVKSISCFIPVTFHSIFHLWESIELKPWNEPWLLLSVGHLIYSTSFLYLM